MVVELAVELVEGEGERFRSGTKNLEAWTYTRKAIEQFRRFNQGGESPSPHPLKEGNRARP